MKNRPDNWCSKLPKLISDGNKYDRGHVLVNGSPLEGSGATKLAAYAALRSGAGLVTVACDAISLPVYAASFSSIMVRNVEDIASMNELIKQRHINAAVIGCGNGVREETRERSLALIRNMALTTVLDADAINVFQDNPAALFSALHERVILTPHTGEFARLFPDLSAERETIAAEAAKRSNAIIVLKGQHTIIASPCGNLVVNDNAPAYLATAGSGDVLAGIIAGLSAQNMPAFEAACAAVYIHAECANNLGFGMIAEDLSAKIGSVMDKIK